MRSSAVHISPEVQAALASDAPVVALETTIVSHGMPYPTNLETALAVEQIVRDGGAIPATMGIIGGEIIVGLTEEQIRFFATSKQIVKATERDIPMVVAKKLHAATTAGASLTVAAAAGIPVFVTGGIGGVGPNAGQDFDISADLLAIEQYPVMTVCSGTKAFMDVAATLEYLETHRVPVVTYQSEYFPLFYTRSSGHKVDWAAQSADEIAAFFAAKLHLEMYGGMLVGVPLSEAEELPADMTRAAINKALAAIKGQGITGKAVTPFLLSTIKDETGGRSLTANIALIKNNARVGTQIAVALAAKVAVKAH
ncbi:MAG: pseudouridine-5'-phosphate glycosidase [Anaerolineae bacterium]|nr:pseudouridine-5'-phosphate glycosidase [Anaerolineae bacterium]